MRMVIECIIDFGGNSGIDMVKTGKRLKERIEKAGYTVKQVQKELLLECPQSIYRWFKGQILPSVDHLYKLSRLLDVHMENLLVPYSYEIKIIFIRFLIDNNMKRLAVYHQKLYGLVEKG